VGYYGFGKDIFSLQVEGNISSNIDVNPTIDIEAKLIKVYLLKRGILDCKAKPIRTDPYSP